MNTRISKADISKHQKLIFKGLEYFRKLKARYQDVTLNEAEEGILLGFNDLSFYIKTLEDFHILTEVFYDGDYDLSTTEECIVFDIGMNIGLASLFFARKDFVRKIYSYEPVKETFDQGKYNFSLNKKYGHKIQCFNFGLGSAQRNETFYFHPEEKGNCGSRGLKSPSLKNLNDLTRISVEIREICNELTPILAANVAYRKFIKLDCEGGEYEILEALDKGDLLKFFAGIIIEWHDEGSEILESILLKNEFLIISKYATPLSGLVYAFRRN